jgi:ribosomal protein S6--L-glutamate ligase
MRIVILSREPRSYSTRRVREVAKARGHAVRVIDTLACTMHVVQGRPELYVVDKPVGLIDAVIPRIGASITFYGTAVLRQLEQMGVYTLNTAQATSDSRDKLRVLQLLARHRVGIPRTAFARSRDDVVPCVERLGGAPVVVKLIEGVEGVGVIYAETIDTAYAIVETMQFARQNVLIQKPAGDSERHLVRAIVVGGKVVAAMSIVLVRAKKTGRLRPSAFATVELSPEASAVAERAAQIVGLSCAGLDLTLRDGTPRVLEVSSTPDLEAIELVTGVDVAAAIVGHVEEQVSFPLVDVAQRLTLESGFGVAEITVGPDAEIAGKLLSELALWNRDVQVLSIVRGSETLPNPRADVRLTSGDVMLCYGRLAEIRAIMPKKRGGRRRGRPPSAQETA